MPICSNCKRKWPWIQAALSFRLKCPYCESKQYPTKKSRNKVLLFSMIPLIFILFMNVFAVSWIITIPFTLIILFAVLAIQPFFIELSSEEEPFV
ncbi:hypothetical protein D8M04_04430 [Oceanobacillus piezotolerans]|uniref:Cxxc_20_cxxc protein n=1 Tax=Oceanobacillus piezotolerans TaxID=2448030 RepID=A0A498DP90_9BACI|nr:hypothetical protein D8M04_04430 [Oceanobacillus piezotolerans]